MGKVSDSTNLAETIRNAVAECGLSRLQLSKRTGIHYATIHGFIGGYRDITLRTACKLCMLLDLELRPARRLKKE